MDINNEILTKIIFFALRTTIIIILSIYSYEYLVKEEKIWNKLNPKNKGIHHFMRYVCKFFIIFFADAIILYYLFKRNLLA